MPRKASGATTGTTPARGGGATRGTKRRRGSNNVNSTVGAGGPTGAGTEIYGSGTIIAANPFDDDHHAPLTNNTMMGPNANKMMVMSPSQPNTHMHPLNHAHHVHQVPPPTHLAQHQQPPPPPPPGQFHHQQRPMHHPHQQHPHHHPQQQHPHQIYSPHQHPHPQHQNNHYSTMQQPMSINPHAQMGTPPMMGQAPLPPPPQSMHPDQFGHHPHHQHGHPNMHNHGHLMPGQPPHHHQNYGPPPLHQQQQQPPPPPPPNHQQQAHMIGTSTPPNIMGGPAPSHSPYITPQPVAPPPPPPPQQQPPPPPPQQQQQQPPPPHHIEQMPVQQPPPYASNHNVYCGKCQRDVYHSEPHIICKAGCKLYFHISCSGLTQLACDLLLKESSAEWACDRCTSGNRQVPFVKYANVSQLHVQ